MMTKSQIKHHENLNILTAWHRRTFWSLWNQTVDSWTSRRNQLQTHGIQGFWELRTTWVPRILLSTHQISTENTNNMA